MEIVNLKLRILVPLVLVSALVLTVFIVGVAREENEHINEDLARSVEALQGAYQAALKERAHKLTAALEVIVDDIELRASMKESDREALLARTMSLFQRFQSRHEITHFYFHDPQRVNLLRIHQPSRYGDTIARFTLLAAERSGKVSYGVELGPLGTFTLRAVAPVHEGDQLLGYIELGEEVEHLVADMALVFGVELFVAIDKRHLERADWEAGMRMLGRDANWDLLPTAVIMSQTRPVPPEVLSKTFTQSSSSYEANDTEVLWEGQRYRTAFVALRDAGDHEVGSLLILRDMTARINSNYMTIFLISAGALLLGSLLFGFFYFIPDRAERELNTRWRPFQNNGDNKPQRRDTLALLFTLAGTIFLAELAIMLLLPEQLPLMWTALIDATVLVIILSPMLYHIVVRPFARQITLRHQAELAVLYLGRVLDHSTNEIYMFDPESLRFLEVSQGARDNLGYSIEELRQLTPLDLKPEFTSTQFEALLGPLRRGEQPQVTIETEHQRKDGSRYPVEVRLQLSSEEAQPMFVAIIQDISERKQYMDELEHKALYDTLTELPNRSLLHDRLELALKAAERKGEPVAVLLVDVVRLKEVNDVLGHQFGDSVLQVVAARMQTILRGSDTVARLGGDEFVIVLPTMGVENTSLVVRKVQEVFEQPFIIKDTPLEIEAAIGIAVYPDHGDEPTVLLQHADIAMRVAKNETTGFSIYDPEDDPYSLHRLKLLGELRQAINDRSLTLYYQPKIDVKSDRATSVEALARWIHPAEGLICPDDFIPLIERSGLIRPFTLWVLEQAICQCKQWVEADIGLTIAVNLSARNLLDPSLSENISQLLEAHQVNADRLTLEITESAMMSRPERALKVLTRLSEIGLKLSIDDFGTGYSSLAYLKRLPVDELKIDCSFVSGITSNDDDAIIVRSTIDLAKNLGLKVVAEGVEDKETLDLLAVMGCDIGQGYYFSRPLPANELSSWFAESTWGQA